MSELSEVPITNPIDEESVVSSATALRRQARLLRSGRKNRKANGHTNPWESPEFLNANPALKNAIDLLPSNYSFEILKCIYKIITLESKVIALQFPEGLLLYALIIHDIIKKFTNIKKIILLSDVTYGACCIDDYSAHKLGVDLLIHYGHSCLLPIQSVLMKTLYVFVEISFQYDHLINVIVKNFINNEESTDNIVKINDNSEEGNQESKNVSYINEELKITKKSKKIVAVMGTVQFLQAVSYVKEKLSPYFERLDVPQVKPLSPGETLGCTSSQLAVDITDVFFIADGRFHMESAMIRNSHIKNFFRYCPYTKIMTREAYDISKMKENRFKSIIKCQENVQTYGIILGTLGHQGNKKILNTLKEMIAKKNKKSILFLMAEINPMKLKLIKGVDAFIQIACPRLSIDWAKEFDRDVLTPYEAMVALGFTDWKDVYPMDYYSNEKNLWSNYA